MVGQLGGPQAITKCARGQSRESARGQTRFGEYQFLARIGSGGTAHVYKARYHGSSPFGPLVAVKVMLPSLIADPRLVEMFFSEAELLAELRHPNIVRLHEFCVFDGVPCQVMEYLEGRTLVQLARAFAE